ncbi:MAG: preprotein translocase [Bacteroidetes bacterium RIFCSPLOWO2_02_FULL_36_8]|nr:MAG: preprotein translocase [Bacteroidetes bacterium RIFCSPLOWO2_02_FULL_36_8]OFY72183.1 MAG: preprotein translocase [Bacteroidetes bacterium RIFCSPLOWO2_12_FULL_37_12]
MNTLLFIQNFGWGEITIILFIVLLLFGAKKIPELAKGIGQGIKEFRNASKNVQENVTKETDKLEKGKEG